MLRGRYLDNGIHGLEGVFPSDERVRFEAVPASSARLGLDEADLFVVPNGSDHLAMARHADEVAAFLDRGGTLFCFDGWFTDWIPGNRWIYDVSKPTAEVRYRVETDTHDLMRGVALDDLQFMYGISGWWACGYIEPGAEAGVLLRDTWDRAVVVVDEKTTGGRMLLTASGPLGCYGDNGLTALYRNALAWVWALNRVG